MIVVCKAIHVAAAMIWMSGLFALLMANRSFEPSSTLCRWNRWVIGPAMAAVIGLGVSLAVTGGWLSGSGMWLFPKAVLVMGMLVVHGFQSGSLLRRVRGETVTAPSSQATILFWLLAVSAIVFLAETKPI